MLRGPFLHKSIKDYGKFGWITLLEVVKIMNHIYYIWAIVYCLIVLGGIEKNTRVMASRVLFNSSTLPFQVFFKKHPEFAKNDFYITGESYAGHYIPAFASRVHQGNKANEGIHINLKVVLASLHQLFSPFPFSIPLCLFNS